MKAAKLLMSAAASAVLAGSADAQFLRGGAPALPAAAGTLSGASPVLNGVVPPPPLGLGVGPGAQLPGGMNTIWARLGISQEQREFCRRKICRTPAGQLIGRLMAPVSTLSGGVIPPFCPTVPSVAELLDPGPVGAASKAKLDRAGAEERMKAVKYLGTLDCHYWPEAEEALIGALRGDRNECVRYEAAMALAKGCCCTCKVIVALSHVVSCSDADGFPYEKSARVRAVAAHALDRCMANCSCAVPGLPCLPVLENAEEKPKDKEKAPPVTEKGKTESGKDDKKDDKKPQVKLGDPEYPKEYYAAVAKLPREQIGAFGRRALELGANIGYTVVDEINPRDYAAAGLTAGSDGQSSGAKPKTIVELLTWKDSGGSIGKGLVGPPPAYSGVNIAMAQPALQPAERLIPAPSTATTTAPTTVTPTTVATTTPAMTAMPPAFTASSPTSPTRTTPVAAPQPAPIATSIAAPVAAPVVTMPSSGTTATRTPPQPLKVPVMTTAAPTQTPTPAPKSVTVRTPAPAPVPASAPASAPVPVPAPKPAPVAQPTRTVAPSLPMPQAPVAVPAAKLPEVKSTTPVLPPVETFAPAVESITAPVEKFVPPVVSPKLPKVEDLAPVERLK